MASRKTSNIMLFCQRTDMTGKIAMGRNCIIMISGKAKPCSHPGYGKKKFKCFDFADMLKGEHAPIYRRKK